MLALRLQVAVALAPLALPSTALQVLASTVNLTVPTGAVLPLDALTVAVRLTGAP